MKRRLVKKWINRYLKPLVKDMPKVDSSAVEERDGDLIHVYSSNHSIKNGYIVPEGMIIPRGGDIRDNIIRTQHAIQDIIRTHDKVFLRIYPEVRGKRVYTRLITGKVNV